MDKMYKYCVDNGYDLPKEGQTYTRLSDKYIYVCPKHGEYYQAWREHKEGHGCKKCQYTTINKKDNQYFIDKLNDKFKGSIIINKIYRKDRKVYGSFTCVKHNCTYDRLVNRMLDKRRGNCCPECVSISKVKHRTGKTAKKDYDTHYRECLNAHCDLPLPNQKYINNSSELLYKCPKGHTYLQTPNTHLTNHGCPICNESHGERFIRNYLDRHNIKYEAQKKFEDLKDKKQLSYDFYLSDYNILIEYQGIQHYESVDYFGGDSRFETQLYHDFIKYKYAKDNNYKLIELPYTMDCENEIDDYLDKTIKEN